MVSAYPPCLFLQCLARSAEHLSCTWKGHQQHAGCYAAGEWLHGEAVSAGMVMAADLSHRLGWIDHSILCRTRQLLEAAKLPVDPPKVRGRLAADPKPYEVFLHNFEIELQGMTPMDFRKLMAVDKKVLDGSLRLILLKGPLGTCTFTDNFDPNMLEETLQHFCH